MNRLNAAYAFGGIGLLINTINENFSLDIQNYVIVDFDRFKYIVDEIGGVEINITGEEAREINSNCLGICDGLPKDGGQVLLNGAQALAHCRNRHSVSGDFDRTRRQRDFLFSLFERVKTECSISSLSDMLFSNIRYVQTNLSLNIMLDLGLNAVTADRLSSDQGRIPFDGTWNYANKDGRSVVEIDREKNSELLHEFLYGNTDAEPQQTAAQLLLAK
jgi:LCP family protein required for cell wall assembly